MDFMFRNDANIYDLTSNESIEEFIVPLEGDDGVITTTSNRFRSQKHYVITKIATNLVRILKTARQCGESPTDGKHTITFQWYVW